MTERPESSTDEPPRQGDTLRRGWTTGACATAATKAACSALLGFGFPDPVTIRLPGGQAPAFALAWQERGADWAASGIIKDAGDDPDVTHGAMVRARVSAAQPGQGVVFKAGDGVGTVTQPGLPVPVGEAAINPVPRQMMTETVQDLARDAGLCADFVVEISIPGGDALARHTLNARLGIVGGLSILGTTGIVIPYSCAAWIASIHRGIDVARSLGLDHVAACTGNRSEVAVTRRHGLPETALLDMGHFAGGTLKYLRKHPVPRLTVAGGFAKMSKLGQGYMDLHSKRHAVDTGWISDRLAGLGASPATVAEARQSPSASRILQLAARDGLPLGDDIARLARDTALRTLGPDSTTQVEALVINRDGTVIGEAPWTTAHQLIPR